MFYTHDAYQRKKCAMFRFGLYLAESRGKESLKIFLKFEDLRKEPSVRHMVLILNDSVFFKWDNLQKKIN